MGYQRRTYDLKWAEDHDLHGLEVTTKGLPMKKLFGLAQLVSQLSGETDLVTKVKATNQLCAGFAARLVSWNLEDDDGNPVPPVLAQCTVSGKNVPLEAENCADHLEADHPCAITGVMDQDMDFMVGLIMTWMGAVSSVDIPLPQPSSDGGSSETEPPGVASIPVETLSPSLLS